MKIDLNLDAGESPNDLASGKEESLYRLVSSINLACGGHAGDASTMSLAVRLAKKHRLAIGAHPSYPDREGFGRVRVRLAPGELERTLTQQILTLQTICEDLGENLAHVKPHGALYNDAAEQDDLAKAIVAAVLATGLNLRLVGLAGSRLLSIAREAGLSCAGEGFVDRTYNADGTLRSREFADALILDPVLAAEQALRLARGETIKTVDGTEIRPEVATLCIHGDSLRALELAQAVRTKLVSSGIQIEPLQT